MWWCDDFSCLSSFLDLFFVLFLPYLRFFMSHTSETSIRLCRSLEALQENWLTSQWDANVLLWFLCKLSIWSIILIWQLCMKWNNCNMQNSWWNTCYIGSWVKPTKMQSWIEHGMKIKFRLKLFILFYLSYVNLSYEFDLYMQIVELAGAEWKATRFHSQIQTARSVSFSSIGRGPFFPILHRLWIHVWTKGVSLLNFTFLWIFLVLYSFQYTFVFYFWGLIFMCLGIVFMCGNWSFLRWLMRFCINVFFFYNSFWVGWWVLIHMITFKN
jgi:hypothetical protein